MISKIVEFFDVTASAAFDVKPEEAIRYFQGKGLATSYSYADMLRDEHRKAFTIAKMMDIDLLKDVQDSLDMALSDGVPFNEWRKQIIPVLQAKGWWGKADMIDPLTGEAKRVTLGTPHRLATIFRTNMQSAYSVGAWDQIEAQAADAPYLMYDAVDDFRTRPAHRAWDNKVLPWDDKFWRTHYPPNGFNCRCSVIQLDDNDLESMGLTVDKSPRAKFVDWKNPRTGQTERIPEGIDPGFDHNPGQRQLEELRRLQGEKVKTLPKDMRQAAQEGVRKAEQEADKAQVPPEAAKPPEKPRKLTKRERFDQYVNELEAHHAETTGLSPSINLEGMREVIDAVAVVNSRFGLEKLAYIGDPDKASTRFRLPRRAMGGYSFSKDALLFRNKLADPEYTKEIQDRDDKYRLRNPWTAVAERLRKRFVNPDAAAIADGLTIGRSWGVNNSTTGIIYHEMGHRLHALNKYQVDSILDRGFPQGWAELISEYATTSKAEFMAESFALYMTGDREQWKRIYPPLLDWFRRKEKVTK